MYCDVSFGPIMVRNEVLQKIDLIPTSTAEIIEFFVTNEHLRIIHCPDCMFYVQSPKQIEKDDFLQIAGKLSLNRIQIENQIFEYTCPEAGITCNIQFYKDQGLAQPPCCLNILTGMTFALVSEFERFNLSLCLYCGQVLAVLKMPGGQ
eukprot:UN24560